MFSQTMRNLIQISLIYAWLMNRNQRVQFNGTKLLYALLPTRFQIWAEKCGNTQKIRCLPRWRCKDIDQRKAGCCKCVRGKHIYCYWMLIGYRFDHPFILSTVWIFPWTLTWLDGSWNWWIHTVPALALCSDWRAFYYWSKEMVPWWFLSVCSAQAKSFAYRWRRNGKQASQQVVACIQQINTSGIWISNVSFT